MELAERYSVAFKGLKNSSYDFNFEVDDDLFEAYESTQIKGGKCKVGVTMLKSDTQLTFDITIKGNVICECDRCLEDCTIPIDYSGQLVVRISEQSGEYDGEIMWITPAETQVDLTQYIYESIVLSLPYRRVHPEDECNPDMLARFSIVSEEDFDDVEADDEAQADDADEASDADETDEVDEANNADEADEANEADDQQTEMHGISEGDFNKLAALKARMEEEGGKRGKKTNK